VPTVNDIFYIDDDDEEDIEDFPSPAIVPPRKGPGRPKGGRTTSSGAKVTEGHLKELYYRVANHLTPEHRDYMNAVIKGKVEVDPVREMQLLVRYLAILAFAAAEWALEDRKVTQDLAKLLGEHRQALKDLEDMQRRRRDEAFKKQDDDILIDATQKSTLESFIEINEGTAE